MRAPLPASPGQAARYDHEYKREGTAAMFMLFAPLLGERQVFVREQRTRKDFAQVIKTLVDEIHPEAERIVLIMDQLNTHGVASLYEAFAPEEARRLAERLEIHHSPKHGSWLNMAEIELSVLSRQCLGERMESKERLQKEVAAWQAQRNAHNVRVDWRFTTKDARIKLKRLYPTLLP